MIVALSASVCGKFSQKLTWETNIGFSVRLAFWPRPNAIYTRRFAPRYKSAVMQSTRLKIFFMENPRRFPKRTMPRPLIKQIFHRENSEKWKTHANFRERTHTIERFSHNNALRNLVKLGLCTKADNAPEQNEKGKIGKQWKGQGPPK